MCMNTLHYRFCLWHSGNGSSGCIYTQNADVSMTTKVSVVPTVVHITLLPVQANNIYATQRSPHYSGKGWRVLTELVPLTGRVDTQDLQDTSSRPIVSHFTP